MASDEGLVSNLPDTFFRKKRLFLLILLGVLALDVLYLLIAKKQYASAMTIAVENTRATQAVSASASSAVTEGFSADLIESHVNSEVELLTSDDLLEHLVTFRSKLVPGTPVPAPGSEDMAAAKARLNKRIEITPVRKSAIIDVAYRDYTPQLAQTVLQELERTYLQKHVGLQRAAGATAFFARETADATRQREKVEQELADFQASNGFVTLGKEKDLLAINLDRAQTSVLQDTADLATASRQVADLRHQLATTPKRLLTAERSGPNQYVLQQLVSQLTDLRNRRITLGQRFISTDRVMREVDEQINSTQATLDAITAKPALEKTEDNNPSWLALDLQLHTAQVALAGVTARLQQHRNEAAQYGDRLTHLQNITAANNALEQRAQEAAQNQQTLTAKQDAARVEDLLDVGRFGNVAVALDPTFSSQVVKPLKVLYLALGLVTAVFLCIAAAVILESVRQTIITPKELEQYTSLPILATVPESSLAASLVRAETI